MNKTLTLGSLFSGSGTFEMAGLLGIGSGTFPDSRYQNTTAVCQTLR